jgi:SAM-dependent methyltransferase
VNPFGSDRMAEGYARFRPPVHARVIERARPWLPGQIGRALDVGCGSGVSTKALDGFAREAIGIDPVEAMVRIAPAIAPRAQFVAASAEAIPLRAASVDLITAAGALNYVNLGRFFREAARVLAAGSPILVYDFGPGRSFPDSDALDRWFETFSTRYPWPAAEAAELDPERLAAAGGGFQLAHGENFEIAIPLRLDFFIEYMMTETNVAAAIRRGEPAEEIRRWCAETLGPLWRAPAEEILFRGYFAVGRVSSDG